MQKVLKEVTEHRGELILFIDEVHTIVGAGGRWRRRAGRGQRIQTDDGAR